MISSTSYGSTDRPIHNEWFRPSVRDNVVHKLISLQSEWTSDCGSISGRTNKFFPTPKHPYWLWACWASYLMGNGGHSSPGRKWLDHEAEYTHLRLLLRWNIGGAVIFSFPIWLHWHTLPILSHKYQYC